MQLREWASEAVLETSDEKALALLREIHQFQGPGWVRPAGEPLDPYGDVSTRLLDLELVATTTEPMGTFTGGREDYGTVWRVTSLGIDELGVWK